MISRTQSVPELSALGRRMWSLIDESSAAHLLVIATSGFVLGEAALVSGPDRILSITILKREHNFDFTDFAASPGEPIFILDSTVRTGRTLSQVVANLREKKYLPSGAVVLYSSNPANLVRDEIVGVPILSVYDVLS